MTDEQINIAISEQCGWVWYRIPNPRLDDRQYRCLCLPAIHEYEGQSPGWLVRADGTERICNWSFMQDNGHVLDYVHDLNAMHEAESIIGTSPDWSLAYICAVQRIGSMQGIHATARQRAEAFLRTVGKWVDDRK